ncbi:TPA: hypothetical protein ACG0QJ_001560 [Proteus mirabilis]|uniref:hypothetical protein n=1 Tax=Proteus mirabilis TaxID=584 RepID=UPI0034E53507
MGVSKSTINKWIRQLKLKHKGISPKARSKMIEALLVLKSAVKRLLLHDVLHCK